MMRQMNILVNGGSKKKVDIEEEWISKHNMWTDLDDSARSTSAHRAVLETVRRITSLRMSQWIGTWSSLPPRYDSH